jgi:hypothetical protein
MGRKEIAKLIVWTSGGTIFINNALYEFPITKKNIISTKVPTILCGCLLIIKWIYRFYSCIYWASQDIVNASDDMMANGYVVYPHSKESCITRLIPKVILTI